MSAIPSADTLTLGAIVTVALGCFKLCELLVSKVFPGPTAPRCTAETLARPLEALSKPLGEVHTAVAQIEALAEVRDPDGVPLIYYPRRACKLQEEALAELRQMRTILAELLVLRRGADR